MELRHLRHFATLARVGHFGQAAAVLNLAQPSLSRSIQKLESLLEVSLLDRRSKSVKLTPCGELLLKQGEQLLEQADQLKQQLNELKQCDNGTFVIGTAASSVASLLGLAVGDLMQHCPFLELDLRLLPAEELRPSLSRGELSLVLTDTELPRADENCDGQALVCVTLPAIEIGFYCRSEHPLRLRLQTGTGEPLLLADLGRYPLAIPRHLPPGLQQRYSGLLCRERDNFAGIIRYDQLESITSSLQNSDIVVLVAGELARAQQTAPLTRLCPVDDLERLNGLQLWHRSLFNHRALAPLTEQLRRFA